MRVIGLTGGIASGKSLVADFFRQLGATVLSADAIAREIVEPGSAALRELVEAFGSDILEPDGRLDRKKLADLIFRDPAARKRVNAITHPHIRGRLRAEIERLSKAHHEGIVVVDIPLLLDTAPRDILPLEGVVVVVVDRETQLARLMARDGLSREAASRRLQAQRPLAEKLAEADWVIDNSANSAHTRQQVERLWNDLHQGPEGTG